MELKDITKEDLINKQIVIVELAKNNFLTFLVTDCESPQVPGYSCCALSYYDTDKQARKAIIELYDSLKYYPKYSGYKTIWR